MFSFLPIGVSKKTKTSLSEACLQKIRHDVVSVQVCFVQFKRKLSLFLCILQVLISNCHLFTRTVRKPRRNVTRSGSFKVKYVSRTCSNRVEPSQIGSFCNLQVILNSLFKNKFFLRVFR